MTNNTASREAKPDTFRAFVWSPINKGQATLELSRGTKVIDLLRVLARLWGQHFDPDMVIEPETHYADVAGWCVLYQDDTGVFHALTMDDVVPSSPAFTRTSDSKFFDDGFYRWMHSTYESRRSWVYPDSGRKARVVKLTADRKDGYKLNGMPVGGILRGEPDIPLEDVGMPTSTREVDVRLVVTIAVAAT